jgi:Xaa-Pro aminopeptidase
MIKLIGNFLSENGLDAFLVLTKINRQYLSGFTGSFGALLISRKQSVLFTDDRYLIRAKRETTVHVKDFELIGSFVKKAKLKKIAVEDRITIKEFNFLKKRIKANWKITSALIESLRAVKAREEITAIEKGSRIIDKVFEKIKQTIKGKRSITEAEIAYKIAEWGKDMGADGLAFDPIVAFGPNAASPHHFSSNARIGRNNFLLLDYGFKVNGYHSDFTRTLFLGTPNKEQAKVYETVLQAQLKAISKIKMGVRAALVDEEARKHISKAGFGKYFTHNTGHGVGLEIHELPNFSSKSEDVLKQNMVVTVEPGIYLPGKFGVRIEDMAVVGLKPRIMSKIPKDLNKMIIK